MAAVTSLLEFLAASPPWLNAAVTAGLVLHIGGGSAALLSGFGALAVRKGSARHVWLGKVFAGSMMVMAGAAVAMAALLLGRRPMETVNLAAGLFAGYLVFTGWMTVRRGQKPTGAGARVALIAVVAIAALSLCWALLAATSPLGKFDGYRPVFYYVFAGFAGFAAALDLKVMRQGGVAGAARIARHLWRMCAGLLFASGSFFLGQQKIMPAWLKGSPVLTAIALLPLAALAFWMLRIRIGNRFKRVPA